MDSLRFFGIGIIAVAAAGAVSAQNLVSNGDLTSDVTSSWTTENAGGAGVTGSTVYDNDSGSAAVGCARLNLSEVGPDTGGVVQGLSQCITSPGAGPWDFGGRMRITFDNPGSGGPNQFFLALQFYSVASCGAGGSASQLLFSGSPVNGFVDGVAVANWTQLSLTNFADPMPGGNPTVSVRIAMRAQTDGAGDGLSVLFDSIYFGPVGTTPVELQGIAIE